ncbi:MAG: methyltransferase domain-containing protein [bacterium]
MADKKTIDSYNKIAEEYHKRNAKTIWSKEYKTFRELLVGKSNILEIGCGTGRDAEELVKMDFNYTGIDASSGMLNLAKKRVPKGKFIINDFFKLDFPAESFDGFWAAASFLHVPKAEIDKVLIEAKRILRQNGIGFISMKEKTDKDEGVISETKAGGIQRYFAFYKQEEFSQILERNGFQIIEKVIEVEDDPLAQRWLGFFVSKA